MRPLKSLISMDKARQILENNIHPLPDSECEELPIRELNGRVAACDILADQMVPPFRRAAMDGYAIIAETTFGATEDNPVYLEIVDVIHAGEVPNREIDKTTCSEIATGAMLPDSADTVIQVELINIVDNKIEIVKPIAPGMNVSKKGVDITEGEKVISKNQILTPGRVGVLAALNIQKLTVYRKPKISIIPTGREVAALGTELQPGQVYDINSYTTSEIIKENGGIPIISSIIPDDFDELEEEILKHTDKDLIVVMGGSSAGERDVNVDIVEKHGKILYHGVQIKPGKPSLFGFVENTPLFNLPGYPTSCLTNAYIFLAPMIRKMAHLPQITKKKIQARFSKKFVSRLGRHQILTVRLEGTPGNYIAVPVFKESGAITSMALADGYIEIPYNVDLIEKDEEVLVTLF